MMTNLISKFIRKNQDDQTSFSPAIKTKIAAWWIIIITAILILWGLKDAIEPSAFPLFGRIVILFLILLPFLLSMCGAVLLLKKRKWVLTPLIVLILITTIYLFFAWIEEHYMWKFIFFSHICILALLIFDRKNFLKIAE